MQVICVRVKELAMSKMTTTTHHAHYKRAHHRARADGTIDEQERDLTCTQYIHMALRIEHIWCVRAEARVSVTPQGPIMSNMIATPRRAHHKHAHVCGQAGQTIGTTQE